LLGTTSLLFSFSDAIVFGALAERTGADAPFDHARDFLSE
jgi:hypothetical protein